MSGGRIVHSIALNHGLTHSEALMPAVDAAMRASGLTCADIDAFAAVAGPGSFTGVRIGVCTAKGLAHAAGKPCAAVDALEALAMNFYGFGGLVCPILDARRGQVYCALFDASGGMPRRAGQRHRAGRVARAIAGGSDGDVCRRRAAPPRAGDRRAAGRARDAGAGQPVRPARRRGLRAGGGQT